MRHDAGKSGPDPGDMGIRCRPEVIESIEKKERRRVIRLPDTFIDKNRLKQQAMGG
jgi:hypothetical protein